MRLEEKLANTFLLALALSIVTTIIEMAIVIPILGPPALVMKFLKHGNTQAAAWVAGVYIAVIAAGVAWLLIRRWWKNRKEK